MISAAITVSVLFIRFFIEQGMIGYDWSNNIGTYLHWWFEYIIVGVTIIVVAVPEGLPLAVIISLAYSVRKMLDEKNFVKRLAACEIMGGANNICSDKTGTLTLNQMTLTDFWMGSQVTINTNEGKYNLGEYVPHEENAQIFLQGLACNTVGTHKVANATDQAILKFYNKTGFDYEELRSKHIPENYTRFQFTSKRKKMSTIIESIENTESGYGKRLMIKGASEIVLGTCSHYLDPEGNKVEITDETFEDIRVNVIEKMASQALRTICVAYKDLNEGDFGEDHDDDHEDGVNKAVEMNDNVCIAILGIRDVIRPEVPGAVSTCQSAGIAVRMVTGDNIITAEAIAKDCGIIPQSFVKDPEYGEYEITTGQLFAEKVGGIVKSGADELEEVANLNEFKLYRKHLKVLARSRPEDKHLLATGLKQCGDVVAVTGDGTNDAPALKKADVGFAMGITGTDVAKHASDIIILDDSFASIVNAAKWGRNIYDNIRRFLQFQLTVNVGALISAFIGSCILRESPLKPIQLLWVNLIMDSLASLALATEPPTDRLLQRPPQGRDDYIINRKMVKHIMFMSIYQSIIIFSLVFLGERIIPEEAGYEPQVNGLIYPGRAFTFSGDPLWQVFEHEVGVSRHYTMVFTTFVFMQICNMVCARKINDEKNVLEGFFSNGMYVSILFIIIVVQFILSQFTADVFKVARGGLWWEQWVICLVLSFTVFIVNFIIKFFPDSWGFQLGKKQMEINDDNFVHTLRKKPTRQFTRQLSKRMHRADSSFRG